jgi:exopolysaccharide/PEP-CTERM locus tyrosine autokinase
MGKFADALEKVASYAGARPSSKEKPQELLPQRDEEDQDTPKEIVESLQLKPRLDDKISTQQSCRLLPTSELLVCCRQDGNREINFAAEQFKVLRSQILFSMDRAVPKTILVTSAIPGEGKSIVASNLAVSIALGKQEHVLLIECDLRRPSLCKIFGIGSCRGLSDYLQGEEELGSLLQKTAIDKLTLLPGGSLTKNPYELLTSTEMRELLEEARNRYEDRYIILDSTPAQVAAETGVLSKFTDGIVFVIGYGKSSRNVIQETLENIAKEKVLGVVFNMFEGKYSDEYYYKYYGGTDSTLKRIARMFGRT